MFRRALLAVCLALAGPVLQSADAAVRAADPSPTAKAFLVFRQPMGDRPLGHLFIKGTARDGSRFDLGASVRLVGTPISNTAFEASSMKLRFVVDAIGGDGDVSTGRALVTFDAPYTLTPGTTSLGLSSNEMDQLFAGFEARHMGPALALAKGSGVAMPKHASFDAYVTHVQAREATGSGGLITAHKSRITAAGGLVTLLGQRIDPRTIRVDRLRLRYFGSHHGAKRRGSLTITLTEPEVVTRGLTSLQLDKDETAQLYDAMATKLHQPRSRPTAPSRP